MFNNKRSLGFVPILIAVLLPILLLPLHNGHDWGDDFAQYLLQAKNITGEPSEKLVTNFEEYSPANKGWLFSILLVPVTLSDSHELLLGKIVITFFLLFLGTMLFVLLKSKTNVLAAALITGFFIYNYHILSLKDQILPDLLFAALLLVIEYVNGTKSKSNAFLITAILILLMTGIRSAGMVAFPALVIVVLLEYFFYGGMDKKVMRSAAISVLVSFAGMALFLAATGSKAESSGWYLKLIYLKSNPHSILENLNIYREAFRMFFEQEVPSFVNTISLLLITPAMVFGLLFRMIRKIGFTELFVIFYCGLLLIYPYHHEPIRFLVPVFAIGIIYMTEFYTILFTKWKPQYRALGMVGLSLFLLVTNLKNTVQSFTKPPSYLTNNVPTKELFNYVETKVPSNQIVSFYKPWAFSYFTGHPSVPSKSYEKASFSILTKSDYLYHFGLPANKYTLVFVNEEYKVYKTNINDILFQ